MIINLPTDIEKKVDHIYISLPYSKLSVQNLLKHVQPPDSELKALGRALKIRIEPGDSEIDHRQRDDKAGKYWDFNFNCKVVDNNKPNFDQINRFTNHKVVLFIGTSTFRYQLGTIEQPLDISFRELTDSLNITISGDGYLPASRKQIVSFRTTF